ncbi:4-hydroxy-3-methylbut-2-enyl diphosphate reductase [Nocardia transvalensis]|uniref:4-hydroxy-3-methylbut-2-enyl diphosphate reductase n=1 Tax=Nocardia transvalensis TaxID=37333 RepID=A0A7W9UGI1_9NOCA|nr:hypothetical protein [Nocardia transvalensis]MBB5912121.1 4-hydroxy-3-methylbut-2-enyl diphosphate reductase [Nocardia transvalensis]
MHPGTVCAPLRSEWAALRGATAAPMVRTGRGPTHRLNSPTGAIAVAGVAGALDPALCPGDLVVAQEIRRAGSALPSLAAPLLHAALRRLGLPVHLGPIFSAENIVDGPARTRLATTGALAVDTESAFLADAAPDGRTVVVRAIVDTPGAPLVHPGTVLRGIRALHALRCAAPVLDQWSAALGEREVVLCYSPGPGATGVGHSIFPARFWPESTGGSRPKACRENEKALADAESERAKALADAESERAKALADAESERAKALADAESERAKALADAESERAKARNRSRVDLVLVLVGPAGAEPILSPPQGIPVYPVDGVEAVDLRMLRGVRRIAMAVTPSAPAGLASDLITALAGLGPVRVRETTADQEHRSTLGR